jgi:acyl-CoA dehydrogenase
MRSNSMFAKPTSKKFKEVYVKLLKFMDDFVYPNEALFAKQLKENPWAIPQILTDLQQKARAQGLWNLFLSNPKVNSHFFKTKNIST